MSPLTQEKVMVEKRLAVASGQIVSSLGAELGNSCTAKATRGHSSGVKKQECTTAHKQIIARYAKYKGHTQTEICLKTASNQLWPSWKV